ncbi:hypothetical protein [Streptosporangium sp. NPDC002524]
MRRPAGGKGETRLSGVPADPDGDRLQMVGLGQEYLAAARR